jgi:hypothetical protein
MTDLEDELKASKVWGSQHINENLLEAEPDE